MKSEVSLVRRTTLRDLGNGLIILGLILLAVYVALFLLAFSVYAGESWKVWTYPSLFGLTTGAIVLLLSVGAVLRYLPASVSQEKDQEKEE